MFLDYLFFCIFNVKFRYPMEGKNRKRLRVAESSCPMKSTRKNCANKCQWTKNENVVLVDCLVELTKDSA